MQQYVQAHKHLLLRPAKLCFGIFAAYYVINFFMRISLKNKPSYTISSLDIYLFILITLLFIFVYYICRIALDKHKKYKAVKSELKELQLYSILPKDLQTEEYTTPESGLFKQIESHVVNTRCYLDNEISREKLAIELGTNYKYLTDAIKAETGKTFNDYITSYRIEHAKNLITLDPEATIQSIYLESGFNNKNTFYRHFVGKYKMSPSKLRASIKENMSISDNDNNNKDDLTDY